jgi:hypothetical protein
LHSFSPAFAVFTEAVNKLMTSFISAPATHFVPAARYDFNPDGSFTFRERDRQGRIKTEVSFTSDGDVISDDEASAIRDHEEDITAILERAREARHLKDFIDIYRQLETTPPDIK